jgi:2-polyprenyl-3-methyl-5-hydroxy-6-metoxy-1,4-benzoquinol methylase
MHNELVCVAPHISLDHLQAYWGTRPCNVRHLSKPIGSNEYFHKEERRRYSVEPRILGFAQFERRGGKKVLELGCSIGTDRISFARCGALVTVADLLEKSFEIARKR